MEQKHSVADYFDATSQRWEDLYRVQRPWRGRDQNFFSRLQHVKNLIAESQGDLLDVGCGTGMVTAALYHPGLKSIQGIDLAPSMIERATENLQKVRLPIPVQFDVLDAENTGFPEASFDVITALGVLEYVDDPVPFLTELARIARPGASIVITAPNRISFSWNWETMVDAPARRAIRPAGTLLKYKLRNRTRAPVDMATQVRHVPYTSRKMRALAKQVGLTLDTHLYCTYAWSLVEKLVPLGGPVTRMMDRVADRTWLTWGASNIIVRLKRPGG